jgi:hypothetical protein
MNSVSQSNQIAAVMPARALPQKRTRALSRYAIWYLIVLFLLSLPLVNPLVRGDGVGYYAYVRAVLINHNLHFEKDWLMANSSFAQGRVDASGHLQTDQYSPTGYVKNHFSVGPAILWAPFLIAAHGAVLVMDRVGAHIPADGYSRPYLTVMAAGTAFYGFLGLLLAFDMSSHYVEERWALLATLGIWFGSSLPVYMYFNPSWSHAHSAFAVALFLWYWHRTRGERTFSQWLLLGLMAGLMINVYYPNAILLLIPALEAAVNYSRVIKATAHNATDAIDLLGKQALFVAVTGTALVPTLVTRKIIYGTLFESGYPPIRTWFWTSPKLLPVLFSTDHGMLAWTPILILAILGLLFFWRRDHLFGAGLILSVLAFYYFIASYPDWDGISSFGNRFFISMTSVFILGLSATLEFFTHWSKRLGRNITTASCVVALLVLWNFGLMFQWGSHMIPVRGPVSFSEVARNQFFVVPRKLDGYLQAYLFKRKALMQQIENRDLEQLEREPSPR